MTKEELLQQLSDGTKKLSHSSFNKFFESPFHFLQYFLEKKEPTPAMMLGTLVHSIILEPDTFDEKYIVLPKCNLATSVGKAMLAECELEANGRKIIRYDAWETATKIKIGCYKNKPALDILMQITETEKKISFDWYGWQWTGFIDGIGESIILDVKKVKSANPWAFRSSFFRLGLHRQAFLYMIGSESFKKRTFYNLVVDEVGGVSVHRVDSSCLDFAEKELKTHLLYLKECILLDRWSENYDFYSPEENGIFSISKNNKQWQD